MLARLAVPFLLTTLLTGCATILDRSTERIRIDTDPPGASVEMTCSGGGGYQADTPADIDIVRRQGDCLATILKAGYETQTLTLEHGLNRRILWNLLPLGIGITWAATGADGGEAGVLGFLGGGVVTAAGFAIDWISGRNDDHDPKRVRVVLAPAKSP